MKKVEMAWHEPGGGDNKPKDPWQGNKSNQSGPPDFDEVLGNLSKKLGGKFGGGRRGGPSGNDGETIKIGLIVVALILAIVWAASGFYTLREAERGVVLRFGEYVGDVGPGLHWKMTFIEDVRGVDIQTVNSMPATGTGVILTQDENVVRVEMDVQYRIADPFKYLFSVQNPEDTLQQAMDSALRYVVGHTLMDDVLTKGREVVRQSIWDELDKILEPYQVGLEIVDVNIQQARPPEEVKEAFDDAIAAQEDERTFIREAEAYAREVEPQARGRVKRILEEANAYQQKVVLDAEGEVAQFSRLLTQYQIAPEITRQRIYLETIEEVYGNSSKVLVDTDGGNNLLYLPLDKMAAAGALPAPQSTNMLPVTPTTSNEPIVFPKSTNGRTSRFNNTRQGRGQ